MSHPTRGSLVCVRNQAVSMLLRSGADRSGAQKEYSAEMLAAEINGISQGSRGLESGRGGGGWGIPPRNEVCSASFCVEGLRDGRL